MQIYSKNSGYVFNQERSSCTNGAYINWDNISWSPEISSMSEYKTRCTLYFKEALWREWIEKEPSIENDYATLTDFLANKEDTEKIFNSEDATAFLIENPSLIDEIKSDPNYMNEENIKNNPTTDIRSVLVKTIIESTALTNAEKFENKLPCYLYNNGVSLNSFSYRQQCKYCHDTSTIYGHAVNSTNLYLSLNSQPGDCSANSFYLQVNVDGYSYGTIKYTFNRNNSSNSPNIRVGFFSYLFLIDNASGYGISLNSTSTNRWSHVNISNVSGTYYATISLLSCWSSATRALSTAYLYEWYLF